MYSTLLCLSSLVCSIYCRTGYFLSSVLLYRRIILCCSFSTANFRFG